MEREPLLERIHELEREIAAIRGEAERRSAAPAGTTRIGQSARRLGRAAVAHWTLVSFLFAIGTAAFIKYRFGVDYLEEYRSLATTRSLSRFYASMGDRLVQAQEWKAAEKYYEKAIDINPNNVEAQYGMVKAQVFLPPDGERWPAPEVVTSKLEYLLELFPDDYQVYFLRGQEYQMRYELDSARVWYARALARRPDFSAGYISMGHLELQAGNVEGATTNFEAALRASPRSVIAHNNLGFSYMVRLRFEESVHHLETSFRISPRVLTALNLGDAARFSGDPRKAMAWHLTALQMLEDPQMDSTMQRYVGGEWTFNYMPLERGDTLSVRQTLLVSTPERRKSMAHYSVAVDYALVGDFARADRELAASRELDSGPDLLKYQASNLISVFNLAPASQDARRWLASRASALGPNPGKTSG